MQQRVGKKVVLKSLQIRGNSAAGTAGTVADSAYLIVYDKRPTGSLPAITDILQSVASDAMNNDNNSGRFRILKRVDRQFIGNRSTPATGCEAYTEDDYLSLKGLPVTFKSAGTGAIADIEEGALYLVTVGNTAAGTAAPVLAINIRTRFMDI